jgi:hypothetical protein
MDLVAASMKEEGGQHVHGWENITIAEVKATAVLKNKLVCKTTHINLGAFRFPSSTGSLIDNVFLRSTTIDNWSKWTV